MIKLIGTAYKREDLTTEEFFRYWRDVHAPISGAAPGLRGYVVTEVLSKLAAGRVRGLLVDRVTGRVFGRAHQKGLAA